MNLYKSVEVLSLKASG